MWWGETAGEYGESGVGGKCGGKGGAVTFLYENDHLRSKFTGRKAAKREKEIIGTKNINLVAGDAPSRSGHHKKSKAKSVV